MRPGPHAKCLPKMPNPPSALAETVTRTLRDLIEGPADDRKLQTALRLLAKWRSQMIDATVERKSGSKVLFGPFKGMDYGVRAAEGARAARLIGVYEASLAPVIEEIVRRAYPLVIDVGAAEGYYAVGLARRMPGARVLARDESEAAQALCGELARRNGVEDRVEIGGRIGHADLDICAAQPTLVLCDIEGAEDDLLDPEKAPGLRAADLLVEVHEAMKPGLTARLVDRFRPTHRITALGRHVDDRGLPAWMEGLSDLDRLLALWEWRSGPTPWLWMERR